MTAMILPPDKTFNYKIPQLSREYVRTGVLADGSCFFHSYLRAFNYKYKNMSPTEKKNQVRILREKLAEDLNIDSFRKLSGGEHRKLLFFSALRSLLEKSETILEPQKLVKILEVATTYEGSFYEKFIEESFKEKELSASSVGVKQRFVDKMKDIFYKVNEISIDTFKHQLLYEEVSSVEIEYIARHLMCNFIFIYETERGVERYPFSTIIDKNWPFCVLLWVDRSHYEVIGRKEENSVIARIFYEDDEIIRCFGDCEEDDENELKNTAS